MGYTNGAKFTQAGNYMTVYINEDGKNTIEILNTKTLQPIDLPDFAGKSINSVAFSNDENWLRMYVGGTNAPYDLYTLNLKSGEQHRITQVLNKEINPEDLVQAKVIRYPHLMV